MNIFFFGNIKKKRRKKETEKISEKWQITNCSCLLVFFLKSLLPMFDKSLCLSLKLKQILEHCYKGKNILIIIVKKLFSKQK